jgi:hypothetical protein
MSIENIIALMAALGIGGILGAFLNSPLAKVSLNRVQGCKSQRSS